MFPYLWSLITEDGECMMEYCTRLNGGQVTGASLQNMWKTYRWTLRKNEETHLDTFKMKGLRKILRVLWTAKKKNEWVLNKALVKRELLDTVKARKLAFYGDTMRKQGSGLEKQIMQGTVPGACRQGIPHMAWMDNIKTWTGLPMEESVRMTEDRDKWRKDVHGVANSQIEDA